MNKIQEGMTGKQVADLLENNFSEVSAEIDSTKTMIAAEEERAKGVEKGLTQAVAKNTVDINGLKEYSATKAELKDEADRAKGVEEGLAQAIAQNAGDIAEIKAYIVELMQAVAKNTVDINGLKEYSATKAELKDEADRANNAEKNIATMVQKNAGEIKILGEEIDEMKEKVVYLSQSEYDQLVQSGEIKEDVEYNVYEDV